MSEPPQPHQPHPPYHAPVPPPPPPPPEPPVVNVQVPVNVHHHHHAGPPPGTPVVVQDTSSIHLFHLILTVLSCGVWLPVWVIHAIVMAVQKPQQTLPPVPQPMSPEEANRAAIEQANARARRRYEARALAMQNPMMARELLIGRTDVPAERRPYDDGGLIDVNSVPARELTRFGIDSETAQRIVELREQTGGFTSAEELAMMADLPPRLVPELIEYGLYLR